MISQTPIPIFLFYLVNQLGMFYYIDQAGELQLTGIPTPIQYSPDGWEGMSIGWERNMQKFGLVRSFTISLGFLGDGALILAKVKNRGTVDAQVFLVVQKVQVEVTDIDYAITHKLYYRGEFDFSTYRKSRRKVVINIMEGGRSKELRANENTSYSFPLATDPERIRVKMDGLNITGVYQWVLPQDNAVGGQNVRGMVKVGEEQKAPQIVGFDIFGGTLFNPNALTDDNTEYHLGIGALPYGGIGTYTGTIRMSNPQPAFPANIRVAIFNEITQTSRFVDLFTGPEAAVCVINKQVNLQKGDRIFLQIDEPILESDLTFTIATRFKTTYCWAFKPMDAFRRIVEKVTGSRDYAQSTLLTGSSLCLVSGDSLRSIPDATMSMTLNNFLNSWVVRKCAGTAIEDSKIVLEPRIYFMNDDVIIDLGDVKEMENEPAIDVMFNNLKTAYADQEYGDVNGRYEMNGYQEYEAPPKRISKGLELISSFRADPIGIELYRQNLEGKKTTDDKGDNDCFFLNVDLDNPQVDADGTYYNLKRVAYTAVNGFPYPETLYNIEELTPRRTIREWESYFRSCFRGFETSYLKFVDAKKNKSFSTTGGPGGDFTECESIMIGAMAAPFFQPEKLTFTAVAPLSLYAALQATPRACFRWKYLGETYKGWMLKGSIISKTNQEQKFVMLSHPDNDLTLLENG